MPQVGKHGTTHVEFCIGHECLLDRLQTELLPGAVAPGLLGRDLAYITSTV